MIVLGPTDQGTQTQQLEEQQAVVPGAGGRKSQVSVSAGRVLARGARGQCVASVLPAYLPVLLVTRARC